MEIVKIRRDVLNGQAHRSNAYAGTMTKRKQMLTKGVWASISTQPATNRDKVFCGVRADGTPDLIDCPNCSRPMLPVFNFAKGASVVELPSKLAALEWLILEVCPHCSHSLENYFVRYTARGREVSGGYIDDPTPVEQIDLPYESRKVVFEPMDGSGEPAEDGSVYHQFGGTPQREEEKPLVKGCMACGAPTQFLGCIVYDDGEGMPLTESGGDPVALIIGDADALNVHVCTKCPTLNYVYAR